MLSIRNGSFLSVLRFFLSSFGSVAAYTSIREEKLGDMDDVMFIIWNTLHVFLATLYIRIGKRLWVFCQK